MSASCLVRPCILALAIGLFPATTALPQERPTGIPSDEEVARQLRPIPPRSPRDELAAMRFGEDLTVELVAAEPQVLDPVDVAFDAAGNMYVVEMRDYPFEPQTPDEFGRLRLLRDTDGDGYFETATVFADRLHWPTSVHPWKGGVLVVAPPEVYFLRDTDGDDRADVREVVFTGLGTANVQALANGLLWGVDCRFYLANGGNGGNLTTGAFFRDVRRLSLGRSDLRFLPPDILETVTGGGQFGHTMDDFGRRFVCNNSDHARFIVLEERFLARNPYLRVTRTVDSIAVEGPSAEVFRISPPEPWRVLRTKLRVAGLVPGPVEHGGKAAGYFTSATGITLYRGDALPDGYNGSLFVGDVAGNLVHRKVLLAAGASFRARRAEEGREFLACADLWFRPVNFANGPDGALYICDMYREIVEHPASIPDFMKRHLNLKSGSDRGRIWRVRRRSSPRPLPEILEGLGESELVAKLESPRGWVRDTARRMLLEKASPSPATLAALRHLVRGSHIPAAQASALWILAALRQLDADLLRVAAATASADVREQAVRFALENPRFPGAREIVFRAAEDPAPRVRLFAAYGLGEFPDEESAERLATLLASRTNDSWILTAALSSCSPTKLLPGGQSFAASVLMKLLENPAYPDRTGGTAAQLAEMLVLAGRHREFAEAFVAAGEKDSSRALPLALAGADAATRRGASISSVLESVNPRAAALWRQMLDEAVRAVGAGAASPRTAVLLAYAPQSLLNMVVDRLFDPRTPPNVQRAFIQQCSAVRRDRWYEAALRHWASLTPAVRSALAEALLSREDSTATLLEALKDGRIQPADLAADIAERLRNHPRPEFRKLANDVLGTVKTASADREALIEQYLERGALEPGDPERGRKLFEEHCAKCHGEPGKGGSIGPDLNTVRARDARQIVLAILAPNLEVAPQYLSYTIALQDGRVLTGTIVEETPTALTIGKPDGTTETILRSSIEALRSSGQSLMPTGFEQQLTPRDVADIVAFLLGPATGEPAQATP